MFLYKYKTDRGDVPLVSLKQDFIIAPLAVIDMKQDRPIGKQSKYHKNFTNKHTNKVKVVKVTAFLETFGEIFLPNQPTLRQNISI